MISIIIKTLYLNPADGIRFLNSSSQSNECVILLHGLIRTNRSMQKIESALKKSGYHVCNCGYPSRKKPIELLSESTIEQAIDHCIDIHQAERINFVTHSMGGILIRFYLAQHKINNLGRVVMLAPPNAGSELVDRLSRYQLFTLINGPAGKQLGTDASSLPNSLGPVDYEVGVIAGNKSLNLLSLGLIPGENDGRVSTQSTRIKGMADYIILPYTHTFMMNRPQVIEQTIHFLLQGRFQHESS